MTVFKSFFRVAKRNTWPIVVYVGIMVVMTIMITGTMGSKGQDLTISTDNYVIAIINHDAGDEVSDALVRFLSDRTQTKDVGDSEREIRDALFWGDVSYALVIPEGFGAALTEGQEMKIQTYVSPNDYVHMYVDNYSNRFLGTLKVYRQQIPDESVAESIVRVEEDLEKETKLLPANAQNGQRDIRGMYFYYVYISYPLLAAISSGLGIVLAATLKRGLVLRGRVSSLSESGRNTQLAMAGLAYSSMIWLALVILGLIVLPGRLKNIREPEFIYMMGASYLYMLACVAITLFITSFSINTSVITGVSNVVALGSSFLGGIFVPEELLGENVLRIGKMLPAYWYTAAIRSVGDAAEISRTVLNRYWKSLGVLLLMTAVLLLGSLIVNKYKRQRGI